MCQLGTMTRSDAEGKRATFLGSALQRTPGEGAGRQSQSSQAQSSQARGVVGLRNLGMSLFTGISSLH